VVTAEPPYVYAAEVVRWVDGDTVDLRVDVGFHMQMQGRFRLYGVDTPERGQPNHDEAWECAESVAPPGCRVLARTLKAPDKYGRWLAELLVDDGTKSVAESLLENKLAVPYFGGRKG
jgi:micrococcal nuclease